MEVKAKLREINRNQNGDYYFIYEVPNVKNNIRPGTKDRNELLIVGVPQNKMIQYLNKEYPGNDFYAIDEEEYNNFFYQVIEKEDEHQCT